MQKHVNLVDLVKSFPTNIYLQNLASIQKRTSSVKFAHLAEKSGKGSISNLSTKVRGQFLDGMHQWAFDVDASVPPHFIIWNQELRVDVTDTLAALGHSVAAELRHIPGVWEQRTDDDSFFVVVDIRKAQE